MFTADEIRVLQIAMEIANDPEQMAEALEVTEERVLEIMHNIDQKLAND